MVDGVAKMRARKPDVVAKTFEGIRSLVSNARLAIEAGDRVALGKLMDLNQMLLCGLFVSSPEIERMCGSAREAGALGAKLTGAGGGGCVVALVPSAAVGEAVLAAWRADGFDGFLTTVAPSPRADVEPEPRARPRREGHAVALAHPNIALTKYWGKREGAGTSPRCRASRSRSPGSRPARA